MTAAPARRWADTALVTGLALAAHLLLRQDAVHHLDVHNVVRSLAAPPGHGHYAHFGYQWLAKAVHAWLGPERPVYGALQVVGAVASALAVGLGHRAALAVGLDRARAVAAALGAAACVASLHFATVVEIPGVFALPVAAMWWAAAGRRGPADRRAAARAGLASGVAAAVHSSGHLLPLLGGLALLAARRPPWRLGAVWLAAHAAAFGALRLLDAGLVGAGDEQRTAGFLAETLARWQGLAALPGLAWREWLWPFAPWSLLPLLALRRPALRPAVLALAVAVVGYLTVDLALLIGLVEHGAYALPLALPAAALAAAALPRWAVAIAVAGAAAGAGWHLQHQDPARVPRPEFGRDLQVVARQLPQATFALGLYDELDSALVHAAPLWHYSVLEPQWLPVFYPPTTLPAARERFAALVAAAAARGGPLVLSQGALAVLGNPPDPTLRELVAGLARDYATAPVEHGAFRGLAVQPRR